jgi:hypothetical protein
VPVATELKLGAARDCRPRLDEVHWVQQAGAVLALVAGGGPCGRNKGKCL